MCGLHSSNVQRSWSFWPYFQLYSSNGVHCEYQSLCLIVLLGKNPSFLLVMTRLSCCLQIRDAYMLKIFEDNQTRLPSWCNNGDNKVSFCQILGEYQMELPQYNTLDPYANMNENCPSLPPLYDRPERCWIWTKLGCQCIPRNLALLLFIKRVSDYLLYERSVLVLQFLHEISIYVHSSCKL